MSYPSHGTVSAQETGRITEVPAPQYTSALDPAAHHTFGPENVPYNEKAQAGNSDIQAATTKTYNEMPTPQPTHQQHHPHQDNFQADKAAQNGFQQQQHVQQQGGHGPNNYQNATSLHNLQQTPAPVDCPVCGVREMTRTGYTSGGTTHFSAILLCCCLCLGCIPYMGSWFKDCEHYCGNCGTILAVWHRSGRTEILAHGRK